MGQDESQELEAIIEAAEKQLLTLSDRHVQQETVKIEQILMESFKRLERLHQNKDELRGIASGFRPLDNLLAGFQDSDLFILAARPSMGKTALALNLARNMTVKTEKPSRVIYFSLEMSKEQLVDRLLAAESGIDAWNVPHWPPVQS